MSSAQGTNGSAMANGVDAVDKKIEHEHIELNLQLKNMAKDEKYAKYHGDALIGDKRAPKGFIANKLNSLDDIQKIVTMKNMPTITRILGKVLTFQGFDMKAAAPLVASMSNESNQRKALIEKNVKSKYEKMLHPPLTYLGDAFQYRTADGKFNNVMSPHLGQAGAPYAKTVPSITHPLGALPDPGDLFDKLMARQDGGRESQSGLSSMLIYHATIIIHDIFRTNDNDKNISDSSSYLDLSPLYGYTMEMQRKIRDSKYKLGLLKPDTFAEDRLLRQPPGVCIMLVMYNRYHNYAATQLRRINENGRFSVPRKYQGTMLECVAKELGRYDDDVKFAQGCKRYGDAWRDVQAKQPDIEDPKSKDEIKRIRAMKDKSDEEKKTMIEKVYTDVENAQKDFQSNHQQFSASQAALEKYIKDAGKTQKARNDFEAGYRAAWDKLDDDLFNTARLITCGMYIQVSIHDYLRALMGFHQWNTNFTLEPRADIDHHNVSRGIGNQVTVEFNLLYRFHCAISLKDEAYTRRFIEKRYHVPNADALSLENFMMAMKIPQAKVEPWDCVFGIPGEAGNDFQRNPVTGLFNDQDMINALMSAMDDPISNFGPRNVPKCLKAVEVMGIVQARKWQIGTLNDFREFFDMPRHDTFESVTKSVEIQNALRDLYEHPDKIELYPGVFCESDDKMGLDPGPSDVDSALWAAIFSDAITLVRSDRFYTTDWNTHSLTAWGMKEVTPDNDICKSSVFHRLIQRAFPEWYPYNSVQFFHPFYTTQTNAKFAADQGYAPMFRMSAKPTVQPGEEAISKFEVDKSKPRKPWKPHYLKDKTSIDYVLKDMENFLHPALNDMSNLPSCFQDMFQKPIVKAGGTHAAVKEDEVAVMTYFHKLMKDIIKRESIPMDSATLQIDATRDFAIPVVTRYVADFLGFGHLLRNPEHPKAPYTENEIYQHIENCQIFLCYNSDETKLLKRRKAFTTSLKALHDLVLQGNIGEANRTSLGKYLLGRPRDNPMTQLGFQVADRVIEHQPNLNAAASIMVFVGLHTAYNSVLGFTAALNYFLQEMYDFANPELRLKELKGTPQWLQVQKLAFSNNEKQEQELKQLVVDVERKSIKLPLVLIARNKKTYSKELTIEKDHIVICDIFKANASIDASTTSPKEFISHKHSATSSFADYEPKRIAEFGVTAMIKFFAQMRNPRRGHDAQGRLKKVRIDASAEGYSNYMAPMRISRIAEDVKKQGSEAKNVYSSEILKPETDTYLTAEWNEMVPFPNTWKIRYDGFGRSNYSDTIKGVSQPYGKLRLPVIPDDAPPFYQPQGASHTGGTFADISCACTAAGVVPLLQKTGDGKEEVKLQKVGVDAAEREPTLSMGCGMGK